MWSLGIIFYFCVVGKPLYCGQDIMNTTTNNGYKALCRGSKYLQQYLHSHGLLKRFNVPCFKLLSRLLDTDPDYRITALGAAEHEWFKSYVIMYHHMCILRIDPSVYPIPCFVHWPFTPSCYISP